MDWSPFGWRDEGEIHGLFVEIFELLNKTAGLQGSITLLPSARIVRGLDDGVFDYAISYRDPNLFGDVHYLQDIGCLQNMAISLQARPVSKLTDLHGLRVAYSAESPFGVKYAPLLRSMEIHIQSFKVFKSDTIFDMLKHGRVHAIIVNDALLQAHRNRTLYKKRREIVLDKPVAPPFSIENVPISFIEARGDKSHRYHDKIAKSLRSIGFQKGLKRLYQRYGLSAALSCKSAIIKGQ